MVANGRFAALQIVAAGRCMHELGVVSVGSLAKLDLSLPSASRVDMLLALQPQTCKFNRC